VVIIESYLVAVTLCLITMICWGSHANTLKMIPKSYAFPLYYWDQALGYLLLPMIVALTMGSFGSSGRGFIQDLMQANLNSYSMAMLGGVVFNLANILFVSAVDIAGMAVAFPIGIGIALVEGVIINYIAEPKGNPILLFTGVAMISLAILIDALAYRRLKSRDEDADELRKGILLAIVGGILMGLFYYLVQRSMSGDPTNLEPGKFGPYAAVVLFSTGSFLSNFVFNNYLMAHPFKGHVARYGDYFAKGTAKSHGIGLLGGVINSTGTTMNFIASGVAGPAIAYGLGQGATMVAAIWGVFVWREFKAAPKGTNGMIAAMFLLFAAGLSLLILARL
jgi:glucose uptake protein